MQLAQLMRVLNDALHPGLHSARQKVGIRLHYMAGIIYLLEWEIRHLFRKDVGCI
jgi:hypothetical protein